MFLFAFSTAAFNSFTEGAMLAATVYLASRGVDS